MKKITVFLLCLVFACGSLACGADNKGKDLEAIGYQYADVTKPIVREKGSISFKVLSQKNSLADDFNTMKVFKDLYDQTNVDINWENLSSSSYETRKSLIMSDKKNWPDAIYHAYFSDSEMIRYASRNSILPISDYLKYMPNLSAILEKRPDVKKVITMADGKIYSLPRVEEMGLMPYSNLLFMNKVWLKSLIASGKIDFISDAEVKDGLNLTLTQMEKVLELFKTNDMNGNGKTDDEIPFSFVYQNWQGNQSDLYAAFGVPENNDHRIVKDGKVMYTPVMDEFKDATNFYAKWITKGYIDKTSFENNEEQFLASGKGNTPKLGAFYWWESETVVSRPEDYIVMNPLIGNNGQQLIGISNAPEISKSLMVVLGSCKNPEVLLTYMDRFYDPYISSQIVYGPKGIVFEEELDENNMLVQKPIPEGMTADELRLKNAPMGVSYLSTETWENYINMEPRAKLRLERLDKHAVPFVIEGIERLPNPSFSLEEINILSQYEQSIVDFINIKQTEWLLKGGVSDSEFNAFKAKLKEIGLDQVINVYQSGYERSK